jgi:replication initiation protein RepC
MQATSSSITSDGLQGRGGRFSSPKHRQAQRFCDDFAGLEEDVKRYDLLLLVKRAGKAAGFTPRMIELLDYYMAYTRDSDWEEGGRPIVYQSITRTALDLGVSERQIQKLEKQLFEKGAIGWNNSGNCRRYGVRDEETGKLLYAYGVDLTPLAGLRGTLQDTLHEKRLYEKAWLETKRQISWHRGQIRALLSEAVSAAEEGRGLIDAAAMVHYSRHADDIAQPIRTYMDLETMRALLHDHKVLHEELKAAVIEASPEEAPQMLPKKSSPQDEQMFAPIESSNQQPSNEFDTSNSDVNVGVRVRASETPVKNREQGEDGEAAAGEEGSERPPKAAKATPDQPATDTATDRAAGAGQGRQESHGLEHLTWKQIMLAASDRFMDRLVCQTAGMHRPVLAGDCVRAAYGLTGYLGISHALWAEACAMLGEQAAAVCVVLIDHAMHRQDNPVRKPNGYFRSMLRKAERGELHLHKSIFGILKRGRGAV